MAEYKAKINPFAGNLQLVSTNIVIAFKAGVSAQANLPLTGNAKGDTRLANDTHHLYVWSVEDSSGILANWVDAGDIIDVDWSAITNKPVSSIANIDDAVNKKHSSGSDNQIASTVDTDESGVSVQDALDNKLEKDMSNGPVSADVEISKITPQLKLTDTNSDYARLYREQTDNTLNIKNRVLFYGNIGNCIAVGANDRGVDIGNPVNLRLSQGTISCWIKTSTPSGNFDMFINKENAYNLFQGGNGVAIYSFGGGPGIGNTSVAVNDGNWHHIVLTFQDGVVNGTKIYIDTIAATGTVTFTDQTGNLYIGYRPSVNQFFTGSIDEIKIFSDVKDATWVTSDYNSGNGIHGTESDTGIVSGWHFNEISGTSADDFGDSNDGTLVGSVKPSWTTGKISTPNYINEITVVKCKDGSVAGESSVSEYGAEDGKTIIHGATVQIDNTSNGFIKTSDSNGTFTIDTTSYQSLDTTLTALAALDATAGFVKQTGADTFTKDTNSYSLASHIHDASVITTDESGVSVQNALDSLEINKDIFDSSPNDDTASGNTAPFTAGENLVLGDLVYYKSDGKVWKSKADDAATMPCIGIALASVSTNDSVSILLHGFYQDASLYNFTVGGQASAAAGIIYVSNATAGLATQTIPTTSTHFVQVIGFAVSADILYFKGDLTWVEIA